MYILSSLSSRQSLDNYAFHAGWNLREKQATIGPIIVASTEHAFTHGRIVPSYTIEKTVAMQGYAM
jgi:hypothetical protein